jgi:hypothetical protein
VSPRTGLALFAIALATRLPFLTDHLWAHDSVLYERALAAFDPARQSPHPPGALWYVLLVRAVDALVGDPNRSMILISAVAGAAAVALLYALGARLAGETVGRLAALFLLTSVTFWAQGAVAYPYTLLAALTVLVALLFWRAASAGSGSTAGRRLVVASLAWGLAVGARADLALFLAPAWALVALRVRPAWVTAGALAVAAPVAAWFAASGALTPGGIAAFVDAVARQTASVAERHSVLRRGLPALLENGVDLARYLGRGLYALAPLVLAYAAVQRFGPAPGAPRARTFLLLWALAPLPFYLLVHVGEYGYVFSVLPALCVIAAVAAVAVTRRIPRALPVLASAAVLANAAIFLWSDSPLSARDLARRDDGLADKVRFVKENLDARSTVIVVVHDELVVRRYVGAGYRMLRYDPQLSRQVRLPICANGPCPEDVTVVAWNDRFRTRGDWTSVRLRHGARLRIAPARGHEAIAASAELTLQIVR